MERFTPFVPRMGGSFSKGHGGTVAVIGGSSEYTGAPFFAAAAVLRLGGDLSHIFCPPSASGPIKSYLPDLIVHPLLPEQSSPASIHSTVECVLHRSRPVQSFVLGPGLGRGEAASSFASSFLRAVRSSGRPIVIDADAISVVGREPLLVRGFGNILITPNVQELARLRRWLGLSSNADIRLVAESLGGVTVMAKGESDVVSDGRQSIVFGHRGIPLHVGGQGDILAGALGLFCAWAPRNYIAATSAASEVVRAAAAAAFRRMGRETIASDILAELGRVVPKSWSACCDAASI
jgi:ATP-dependent NAD(P)H-hydrate dehydratase